ncbi:hypothetical protein Oweho_3514 [Owenweeksia hongkongensis DSM 17368]|uniref:ABC-type transport system involved in multi-copper enzyme maturation, permease component n=1 Tax=Owenweeksia hongkongensis (strain DSM 17368 / CIP 108786 / JCM 12287 / NRRL B-23963 / UST20020801) TaxID=926562 RepID=G8R6J9_OWEHD|nr:ABC transporter permease [Owenweeksia hongkongensis]AEV34462.1 hypothetical protein Oweho_3514 [Owenweeksia hongkongensis DSM 17368]
MKLFKLEWLKLRLHIFFWIGMGLYILCMILLISGFGSFKLFNNDGAENQGMIAMKTFGEAGFYILPHLWHNITYLAGFFKFIPAFLLIFFISNEYQYKTFRQNVIDGLSIQGFYISKLFSALIFSIISLGVIFFTGLVIAIMYNPDASFTEYVDGADYLFAFFTEVMFMMVFALFLTFLFRRSTVSIIVILAYYFIVEPILGFAIGEPIKYYLPAAPSRELILQPFTRLMEADMILGTTSTDSVPTKFLLTTWLYTLIFAAGGLVILKKRDL